MGDVYSSYSHRNSLGGVDGKPADQDAKYYLALAILFVLVSIAYSPYALAGSLPILGVSGWYYWKQSKIESNKPTPAPDKKKPVYKPVVNPTVWSPPKKPWYVFLSKGGSVLPKKGQIYPKYNQNHCRLFSRGANYMYFSKSCKGKNPLYVNNGGYKCTYKKGGAFTKCYYV